MNADDTAVIADMGDELTILRARVAELESQRGTLIATGTTRNMQWTPLGEIIVALEAEVKRLQSERA